MKYINKLFLAMSAVFMITGSVFYFGVAAAADIEKHPGYVDFSSLSSIAGSEPSVEISLKGPLLTMITNLLRGEDPEAADFISKLERVSVNVFESSRINAQLVSESMSLVADALDGQKWERVVRVREEGDHIDIYFKLSDDAETIYGIAMMIAEPNDTIMVNIAGDINVNDIAALGRRFDIDELSNINLGKKAQD